MLEAELSVRQQIDERTERLQCEFELRRQAERIYRWYMQGLITSGEAIDLMRPVEFELERLTRKRRDIPFRGESVEGGASAMDAAANDAEVMTEGDWLGCWRVDMHTGELLPQ